MDGPVYTFLACDRETDEVIAELPITGGKWSRVLGGTGSFAGKVTLGDPDRTDLIEATEPNKVSIYVDRDGDLIWGGMLWGRKYDSKANTLEVSGVEFFSYFVKRVLRVDSTTLFADEDVDQFDIMRAFVDYVQSESGGDLGIVYDTDDSGILRDRSWESYELKEIGEAMTQLSEVIDGFDFEIGVRYSTIGVPEKYLGLYYPRRGVDASITQAVFERPGNIISYTFTEDGTKQATRTFATGSGEGDDMKLAVHQSAAVVDQGYPLLDQVVDYKDVIRKPTLQAHADADGRAVKYPSTILSLEVNSLLPPSFGEWTLGDDARITIEDDRFPAGTTMARRIIGWDMEQRSPVITIDTEEVRDLASE